MPKRSIVYLKGRKCCICGGHKTYIDNSGRNVWISHRRCDRKDCTGWLCNKCWNKYYQKNDINSQHNLMKTLRNWRTGELDIDSDSGKGFIVEAIVAKVRKLDVFCISQDNFKTEFDLSIDIEYGRPQVKGPSLIGRRWHTYISTYNFDHIWIVCMNRNRERVLRVYIIPELYLCDENSINIYEDWSKLRQKSKFEWVERFRVNSEPYDNMYKDFMKYISGKKFFGVEDIRKWMKI